MHVQRVLPPHVRRESWTVLGDDGPVQPIERYLAYLTDIERSPNTVKAYAHDLKDWFVFLTGQGLDWREVWLEDVAGFVAWLRRPLAARDGPVAVLPSAEHYCSESTVNRKLSVMWNLGSCQTLPNIASGYSVSSSVHADWTLPSGAEGTVAVACSRPHD